MNNTAGQNTEILQRAIDTWGKRAQYEMLQEEATELALAARKHIRKANEQTFQDLCGEVADVEIMIEQYEIMQPGARDLINEIKNQKVARLKERLKNRSFED